MFADVPTLASLSLASVLPSLRSRRIPDHSDAVHALRRLRFESQALQIVHAYHDPDAVLAPEDVRDLILQHCQTTKIDDAMFEELVDLFPIFTENIEEEILNDSRFGVIIEVQGTAWTFDEMDEIVQNIRSQNKDFSALYFCKYLDNVDIDGACWADAAEYFGWPEERFPMTLDPSAYIQSFDAEQFLELLETHALGRWCQLFRIVWCNTGNPFFDFSAEEAYENAPDLTLETIDSLSRAWKDAEIDICTIKALSTEVAGHPGVLEQIIDLWESCITWREDYRPRTLVEMFGEDEEFDNDNAMDDPDD